MRNVVHTIGVGLEKWSLSAPPAAMLPPLPIQTLSARDQLEESLRRPLGLGAPLHRAVTPDDRITIVLDESLPEAAVLLTAVLEHLSAVGVVLSSTTIVVAPGGGQGTWIDDLPDELADVTVEVHDLEDRAKLAYLGTTPAGKRIYLNRTLVEADFVIVLTKRRYDPTYGVSGGASAIYPILSEPEAMVEAVGRFRTRPPGVKQAAVVETAEDIAWMLGMPFFIQILEGPHGTIQEVLVGPPDSLDLGVDRLAALRRVKLDVQPDLVICAVSGDPRKATFGELAMALAAGARVVGHGGKVVLLSTAAPVLDEGADIVRHAEEPDLVPPILKKRKPDDWPFAQLWVQAASRAKIFFAAAWGDDAIEEFFAVPIRNAAEVQRLLDAAERPLIVPDAHLAMLELGDES